MKIITGGGFKILYHWYSKLKNNKSWEFQLSWAPNISSNFEISFETAYYPLLVINLFELFKFEVSNSKEEDHAGFRMNIRILGIDIDLNHTDCRHWNYEEDRWETQEDIDQQNEEYQQSLLNNKN